MQSILNRMPLNRCACVNDIFEFYGVSLSSYDLLTNEVIRSYLTSRDSSL